MTDGQRMWCVGGAAIIVLLFYLLHPILTPFLVAALLAYLSDPLVDRLQARGISRTLSTSVVFIVLSLLAIIVLLLTVPLIGHQLDMLAQKIPVWLQTMQSTLLPWIQQRFDLPEEALPMDRVKAVLTENWVTAGDILTRVWRQVAGSSLALAALLANLFLIPVVTFYLLRDWDVLLGHIRDLLPRSMESTVVSLSIECDEILGAFIRGQLLVMWVLGMVYSLGLWLVGMDLALILGLTAGLASIVPYMGFMVGIVAASIAAWFQFQELMPLLGVAVVFSVGQMLEGMVLTPLLVGDRIGLHPVAVIFAIMAGGQLAGFAGVLLALPVAAVIMVFVRHLHHHYKSSDLYGVEQAANEQAGDEA